MAYFSLQALHYDVRRGPHSIGSHVRDAAAYVCWAFGRAYTNLDMKAVLEQLAPDLLTVACYDREARFILCCFYWWNDILITVSNVSFAVSDFRLIVEELLLLPFKRMLEDRELIRMALIL